MYKRSGMVWAEVGKLARVRCGEPGKPRCEYGRIVQMPQDGPDFSDQPGTVRTFTGELITAPMLSIDAVGVTDDDRETALVRKLEADPPRQYEDLELNEAQWWALKLAYEHESIGNQDSSVNGQTALALARRGLTVYYAYWERPWTPGFKKDKALERNWVIEITALGRKAWENHNQPPAEPETVEIPGLGRSITVREEPPAPKVPKGVHIMHEGFPEGRYAVEIDGEIHCFWFKYHRTGAKRFQEETLYRREDGRWVSIVRYVPEWKRAVEIIKGDSYTQALRFGTETGHCSACGRPLSRADSLKRGKGDTCAMKEIHQATIKALLGE